MKRHKEEEEEEGPLLMGKEKKTLHEPFMQEKCRKGYKALQFLMLD